HGCGTDIDPTAHVRFFAAFHHAPLCGASADVVLVDSDSARRISSARSRRRCTDLWTITSSGAEARWRPTPMNRRHLVVADTDSTAAEATSPKRGNVRRP